MKTMKKMKMTNSMVKLVQAGPLRPTPLRQSLPGNSAGSKEHKLQLPQGIPSEPNSGRARAQHSTSRST